MKTKLCSLCTNPHFAKDYCETHYRRWKKHGCPHKLMRQPKGKGHLDRQGYVRLMGPRGQTFEHRLIMERHIGRPLLDHETVHHINGIRNDNRVENLELWSNSHPSGQRIPDKIKWAKKFLKQYGYEVKKK